jgi:hypothetical protein
MNLSEQPSKRAEPARLFRRYRIPNSCGYPRPADVIDEIGFVLLPIFVAALLVDAAILCFGWG